MVENAEIIPNSTLNFCGQCGEASGSAAHEAAKCASRRELEPPRFCAQCRRRMVVQIVPRGWTATCGVHGVITEQHGH